MVVHKKWTKRDDNRSNKNNWLVVLRYYVFDIILFKIKEIKCISVICVYMCSYLVWFQLNHQISRRYQTYV